MVMSPATKVARRASGRARHRARANSRLPRWGHQFMGFPWDFHGILGGCLFFSQDCIGFFLGDFSIDFLSFLRDFTGFLASWAPIATWGSGNEGHCWQRSLCRKFGTQELSQPQLVGGAHLTKCSCRIINLPVLRLFKMNIFEATSWELNEVTRCNWLQLWL
jgi:hypothetical protein